MSAPTIAPLRIATRKSQLALWQAEHVAALLRAGAPGLEVELVPMVTQGDRIQDRSLAAIGGKGLFIKELEVALEETRADIAVHSMKDVPATSRRAHHCRGAERADAARCAGHGQGVAGSTDLPRGARVGTSSLRRQAQLLARAAGLADRNAARQRGHAAASGSSRAKWMPSCWPARA